MHDFPIKVGHNYTQKWKVVSKISSVELGNIAVHLRFIKRKISSFRSNFFQARRGRRNKFSAPLEPFSLAMQWRDSVEGRMNLALQFVAAEI
jgi:hypothetical protein